MAVSAGSVQGDSLILNDAELNRLGAAYRMLAGESEVYVNGAGERITFERFLIMVQEVKTRHAAFVRYGNGRSC